MLSDQQVEKLRILWKNRFGEKISKENALREGLKMITLVTAICRPANEAEYQRLKELSNQIENLK